MNSNSTNINFGPAVAFTGAATPSGSRDAELREAQWTIRKLTADLNESRSQHALKSGEVTIAKTAQAKAEKETAIARKIFLASHTMDDYERAVQLQQEIEALQQSNKDTREQLSLFANRVQNLLAEVVSKDDQISALAAESTSLKASLSETKQALADQKTATDEIDSHLNKAYADLKQQESANRELSKAKDEAEAHAQEKELELHDLRAQWEASQDTIAELKSQQTALADLERETTALNDEVANLRGQVSDRDRLFQVKDARIQHLEAQYQKALEGKLNAEVAAAAAAAPTDVPDIFTSGDESLADELAATSDYGDDTSSFEQLDFSDITEIANIAPVARQIAMSSTQTHVSEKNAMATQTDAPKLDYATVYSTAADISPIEPAKASNNVMSTQTDDVVILAERKSQTAAAQTDISNPPPHKTSEVENSNVATQTTPTAEKTPEPTVVHVTPARKKGRLTSWWILSAFCIFLCFYFYAQLQAFKTANGYGYGSRRRYSTGAFGNGRYLFGVIPIGFDIGHDWFSEQVCRQTSTAIAAFEDWAGITPTPLY